MSLVCCFAPKEVPEEKSSPTNRTLVKKLWTHRSVFESDLFIDRQTE